MKRTVHELLKQDPELKKEVKDILESGNNLPSAIHFGISRNALSEAMVGPVSKFPRAEAMILIHLRPSLLIKNNRIEAPASAEVRKRLLPFLPKIEARIPSVGRIDFAKLGRPFGGTGWMITEDILVTNRHVAKIFSEKRGQSITFLKNSIGETIEAYIDFKEEYLGKNVNREQFEVPVEKVLYMTDDKASLPDIAFLKIKRNANLPDPIPLSDKELKRSQFISVIGYPAFDPDGIITPAAASKVFQNIYDVKRCSPGEVIEYSKNSWSFFHDCTTLGGNSGSVVLDNHTGVAVGLHFMGEVQKENYAVKGSEIIKHLRKISTQFFVNNAEASQKEDIEFDIKNLEAAPESYDNREGFSETFLGTKFKVKLPVVKSKSNILTFKSGNKIERVLRYEHFSVVMNKKRRLCFFSACNIDGGLSKRGVARTTWRTDPRIPKAAQIIQECYGNPPQFSRGHMTRKEDPIWGSMETAKTACADTFHVTNATPQMQPFNAPVWLELENYALENARQDDMKISVITGPVFRNDDPERDGVKIPIEFFKIIAFIHDKTGKLCATAYSVSQKEFIGNEEFVYGQFNTYQRSVKSIERLTGLDFGNLSSVDPIKGEEFVSTPLAGMNDVRFN